MKIFIAFLLVFLLFNYEKAVPLDPAIGSTDLMLDPTPAANNVTVNATWTFTDQINTTFVVMTIHNLKSSQYAAMGLGQNQAMGEAHVFMCKRFSNDEIAIHRYVNPSNHTPPRHAGSEQGGVMTPLPATLVDGVVTCRFILSNFPPQAEPKVLRPLSQSGQYHPLFAVGMLNSTGDPQYHDGRQPQPSLVQLNQNQQLFFRQNSTKLFNELYPSL